jgi:hypothetical protein
MDTKKQLPILGFLLGVSVSLIIVAVSIEWFYPESPIVTGIMIVLWILCSVLIVWALALLIYIERWRKKNFGRAG